MYTVRKLETNEVLERIELSEGKVYKALAPASTTWGVIGVDGKVVSLLNALGKKVYEMYPTKTVAEKVAASYNERISE